MSYELLLFRLIILPEKHYKDTNLSSSSDMSLLSSFISRLSQSSFLCLQSASEMSVREASKKAGASTRNKCRNTPGKRRGIKIYDGQRIPHG